MHTIGMCDMGRDEGETASAVARRNGTERSVTACLRCHEPFDPGQLSYRRPDGKGWYTTCLACGQVQPAPEQAAGSGTAAGPGTPR